MDSFEKNHDESGQENVTGPETEEETQEKRVEAEPTQEKIKKKRVLRLIEYMKKKINCSISYIGTSDESAFNLTLDKKAVRRLDSHILGISIKKWLWGFIFGTAFGILAAYFLIPFGTSYFYSSSTGSLPPEYDMFLQVKDKNLQAVQILEHNFEADKKIFGGMHKGKEIRIEAKINDSSDITLYWKYTGKNIKEALGQKKGTEILDGTLKRAMLGKGIDSTTAGSAASAISRTTNMTMERKFRTDPILVIETVRDGEDIELINYLEYHGKHSKAFTGNDSYPGDVETGDHVKVGRDERVPSQEDEELYRELLQEFITGFLNGKIKGEK